MLYSLIKILIDITVADNSQEHNLSMNIDLNNQNTEIISHASSSSLSNDKNISINRQENLGIRMLFSIIFY